MLFSTSLVKNDICIAKVITAMLQWWKCCRMPTSHKMKIEANARNFYCYIQMRSWSTKNKKKYVKALHKKVHFRTIRSVLKSYCAAWMWMKKLVCSQKFRSHQHCTRHSLIARCGGALSEKKARTFFSGAVLKTSVQVLFFSYHWDKCDLWVACNGFVLLVC